METIAKELDVSVILPVYNERGHLKAEIDRVRTALSASSYSFEIIVICCSSSSSISSSSSSSSSSSIKAQTSFNSKREKEET